jgi:DNA-directed RNA polymerase specialized sigma24 family protein
MAAELSDAQLVHRCRAGDADAWNVLVDRYSRYVYAITVRGFRFREHDAEDVFREVSCASTTGSARCGKMLRSAPGSPS